MEVTVLIRSLWATGIHSTQYGYPLDHGVDDNEEYYDLHGKDWSLICCDGEVCTVVAEDDESVTLLNQDSNMEFKLSKAEFEIAATVNNFVQ